MNIYGFSMYLGFTGLASMALLGMSSAGGMDHGQSGHAGTHDAGFHSGHDLQTSGHHAGDGHAHDHSHHDHGSHAHGPASRVMPLLSWLSPRVLFSVLLGFGAAGVLGRKAIAEPWMFALAIFCGVAFELAIFRPVWNFVFRFASRPARTLESAVCEEARAVTSFDSSGHGLISIDLDGQVVQVLGRLSAIARQAGLRVHSGDRLFVEDVDTQKNSCTVSPLTEEYRNIS